MYFYLKEPKSSKETLIYLIFYVKSDRQNFKYSTGQKIKPEYWDFNSRLPQIKRGGIGQKNKHVSDVLHQYKKVLESTLKDYENLNKRVSKNRLKEIFDDHAIHHLPVVEYRTIVGMISKSDFLFFQRGYSNHAEDRLIHESRLLAYTAKDIMTTGLAKLESTDKLNAAIEVFKINRFHALPIVDGEELVGILTTHDIIKQLAGETAPLESYSV